MARLDKERQEKLEPIRKKVAMNEFKKLNLFIHFENDKECHFLYNEQIVVYFFYSGWHTGKSIKDGRGLENLLKQIKL